MGESFLRRATDSARSRLGLPPRLVRANLLGQELLVRDGAVREPPDYDDAWLLACARRAETVFDVGANMGQAAIIELLSPSVREVVLIDPNPEALAIAAENLFRNGLGHRSRFVCAFAGETDGSRVRLWTVGTGAAGSVYPGHARSAARAGSSVEVPTTTLDRLCELYGFVPDLVKIDVEGAEYQVLQGSRDCAGRGKSRYLVEMHSNPELSMRDNAASTLRWCQDLNYAAWYLSKGARLEEPETVSHRGRCHLLLQPASWPYPEWLRPIEQGAPLAPAAT